MREILFRGKEIDTGEWVYGYMGEKYVYSGLNGYKFLGLAIQPVHTPNAAWIVDPNTIGQYTGLCDKNGTKIFEGDIVKQGEAIYKIGFGHHIAPCSDYPYDYGTAYGFYLESDDKFSIDEDDVLEIIGNIYDNPELLEE